MQFSLLFADLNLPHLLLLQLLTVSECHGKYNVMQSFLYAFKYKHVLTLIYSWVS